MYNAGVDAETVAGYNANFTGYTASIPATPDARPVQVLLNLGVNGADATVAAGQVAFEADLTSLLGKIVTRWPGAHVGVSLVWGLGRDASCDTINGWIGNVVAAAHAFSYLADDERIWMKGADNGATMTTDGIHYSAAGNAEKAAQAKAALGY